MLQHSRLVQLVIFSHLANWYLVARNNVLCGMKKNLPTFGQKVKLNRLRYSDCCRRQSWMVSLSCLTDNLIIFKFNGSFIRVLKPFIWKIILYPKIVKLYESQVVILQVNMLGKWSYGH